ncbi:MAG: PorT family protein [Ferruginibacter sp.]|nr:PorT family protein [Cytophagales bacterium]
MGPLRKLTSSGSASRWAALRFPQRWAALRLLWVIGLLTSALSTSAQRSAAQGSQRAVQTKGTTMRAARWWMGFKTGVNYTEPEVEAAYHVFSSVSATPGGDFAKRYDERFDHTGYHIGWLTGFSFTKNIAVFVQPTFASHQFGYQTRYAWSDSTGSVAIGQTHVQTLHYLETPVEVRLSLPIQKWQLYAQFGGFYRTRLGSRKSVQTTHEEINAAGTDQRTFDGGTLTAGTNRLFVRSWKGMVGGGGISYDVDYVRVALECNYRLGLDNITHQKNRFSDRPLVAGVYDVPDDLRLRNLAFSLVCSLPLDNLIHLKKSGPESRRKRKPASPAF